MLPALGLCLLLFVGGGLERGHAVARGPRPEPAEQVLGKFVARLLARHHYSRTPFDAEVSRKLYTEYFERLDHNRSFFLASDLEDFRSYELVLGNLVADGKVEFAYDVYARLLQRVEERVEFVRGRLEEPFDYTVDEAILLDRSEEPWCASLEEMDEIWRRRVKNDVLVYELMKLREEDADEEEEGGADDAAPADGEEAETPEPPPVAGGDPEVDPVPAQDGSAPGPAAAEQPPGTGEVPGDVPAETEEAIAKEPPPTPTERVRSLRICVLLDKKLDRASGPVRALRSELTPDYTGFQIGDEWVVGYGLDAGQDFRELPCIAVLR